MPVAPGPARDPVTVPATPSVSAHAPSGLALVALAGVALLGNGLKAILSSSVLVSEAQFASYLGIAPERVAMLLESLIAGMVVALAACPILLQRFSARALAMVASGAAAAAFCAFALVDLAGSPPLFREATAFVCFSFGGGMLALLAPTAQALVALAPSRAARTALTAVWTGAAPGGFLVAPQLVKVLLPAVGLGAYFLAFSVLPALLLALLGLLALTLPHLPGSRFVVPAPQQHVLMVFVAAVLAFEVWTSFGSIVGYRSLGAVVGIAGLAASALALARALRRLHGPPPVQGGAAWLLVALFVLEMPTTGFFDTAWLAGHGFPEAFIANRSTLGAAAQILGTIVAGTLVHRHPHAQTPLLLGFGATTVTGVGAIGVYPWTESVLLFMTAPALQGFGVAGVTVLVCLAVVRTADVSPLMAALPSLAIMLGTEFGLELLQLLFAIAQAAGLAADGAYKVLFAAQLVFAVAALGLLALAARRPLPIVPV